MSMNAFLRMKVDGTDLPTEYGADFTINAMGGTDVANTLEVISFTVGSQVGTERGGGHGGIARGHRYWEPATFVARCGKSAPIIAKAMRMNQRVDLSIEIFQNNHDTGVTELLYKVEIDQGRVVAFHIENPNTMDPATASLPTLIRFQVTPHTVRNISGYDTEDEDNWATQGA